MSEMSKAKWLREKNYPYCTVYGMKNINSGEIDYVGQSSNTNKRIWEHLHAAHHKNSFLRNGDKEWKKPIVGANNYEVIILWNGDEAANGKPIVEQNTERLFMEAFYIHTYQPKINVGKSTYTKFRKGNE